MFAMRNEMENENHIWRKPIIFSQFLVQERNRFIIFLYLEAKILKELESVY